MTTESFATQGQVLGYVNSNLESILRKPCLSRSDSLEDHNYYIFEEVGKESTIVFIGSKTEFYTIQTQVLIKKTGQEIFSKISSPTKKNINNHVLENKISSGVLQIKHIESDDRIKILMRPVEPVPAQPIAPTGPTRLVGSGRDTIVSARTSIERDHGGHMLDYIRPRDINLMLNPFINDGFGRSGVRQEQTTPNSIQPSAVEEIVEDADYKNNVTCKICLTNKVNIVCIPCGHCFCSECNTKTRNNLCALCRKPITKSQPLFI